MLHSTECEALLCEKLVQQASEGRGINSSRIARGGRGSEIVLPQGQEEWGCTYYPWEFGALCGVVVKAAAEASGDCVRLLESKTHGIHRLAPAAYHPLQRETRRRRYIQMALTTVTPQHRCAVLQAERSLGAVPVH